jgi:hypothetical protein
LPLQFEDGTPRKSLKLDGDMLRYVLRHIMKAA